MSTVTSSDIYGYKYEVPVDQLSWRPAAYGIVIQNRKILLVNEQNSFYLPGGGVNLGETPENAVVREIEEETGFLAAAPKLVGSHCAFFTQAHKPDGRHVQLLIFYYSCVLIGGTLSADGLEDEERHYGLAPEWVSVAEIDNLPVSNVVDWRPMARKAVTNAE